MATITTSTQTRVTRSRSRFGTAFTAFMAILRRDIVITGREFIAFLLQVLLQPLFFLFIFGKVLPSIGFARPGFAAVLLPGIVGLTVVTTALQGVTLPGLSTRACVRPEVRKSALMPVTLPWLSVVMSAWVREGEPLNA